MSNEQEKALRAKQKVAFLQSSHNKGKEAGRDFLNVQEFANLFRIVPDTVYRLIKRGELPSVKIGRSIRIRWADVEEYLKTRK